MSFTQRIGRDSLQQKERMFNRFTEDAKLALNAARGEAQRLAHNYLGTEHILLGLVRGDGPVGADGGSAMEVFRRRAIDPKRLRSEVEKLAGAGSSLPTQGHPPFTAGAKKTLECCMAEASRLGHVEIGTGHLLLGLLKEGKGIAWKVLTNFGLGLEDAREALCGSSDEESSVRNDARPYSPSAGDDFPTDSSGAPVLDTLGRDLTALARAGELHPLIGRQAELDRLVQVLSRKDLPNAVVLGETGSGKSALIHGLAQRMATGIVPDRLLGKRLVKLDLERVLLEAGNSGQLEQRRMAIAAQIRSCGDAVLVMDEATDLFLSGWISAEEGSLGAHLLRAAILGFTPCITSATALQWSAITESQGSLSSRFQPVYLRPTDRSETLAIVQGVRERYELYHAVFWTDEAIEALLGLEEAHLPGGQLPGLAVCLLDEVSAHVRLLATVYPQEVLELTEKLDDLNRQRRAAQAAYDVETVERLREQASELHKHLQSARSAASHSPQERVPVAAKHVAQTIAARRGQSSGEIALLGGEGLTF